MNIFTPLQRSTLKLIWIPVLVFLLIRLFLASIFLYLENYGLDNNADNVKLCYQVLLFSPWVFLFGMEFVQDDQWKNWVIYMGVSLIGGALFFAARSEKFETEPSVFMGMVPMMLIHSYLLHGTKKLVTVLPVVTLIWAGLAVLPVVILRSYSSIIIGMSVAFIAVVLPVAALVLLFVVENYIGNADYRSLLKNKIAVRDALEFAALYIAATSILWSGIMLTRYELPNIFVSDILRNGKLAAAVVLLRLISGMAMIVLSLPVLWYNIIARSLTTGITNYILLAMNSLPILNLFPFFVYTFSKAVHTTTEENENLYMDQDRSIARKVMRVIIVLAGCWGIYAGYSIMNDFGLNGQLLGFTVIVINIGRLLLGWKGSPRKMVIPLYIINILTAFINAFYSDDSSYNMISLEIGMSLISIILLSEIFLPRLGDDLIVFENDLAPAITDDTATSTQH